MDHRITVAHRAKLYILIFSLLTLILLGFLVFNTIRLNRITIETGKNVRWKGKTYNGFSVTRHNPFGNPDDPAA